eukprot:7023676-Heterocapsa_arctica.AAC.1
MNAAAMIRTSVRTLPRWPEDRDHLAREAEEHLPFIRSLRGELWPACWDSPAFAVNLARAHAGFPGEGALHRGASTALKKIRENAAISDSGGVQKVAMGPLLLELYPPTLDSLVLKRLSSLFPEHAAFFQGIEWQTVFRTLRTLPHHPAMCVVKTYLNSWTTTARFHEERRLPCVFGCAEGADSLPHYVACPKLWQ